MLTEADVEKTDLPTEDGLGDDDEPMDIDDDDEVLDNWIEGRHR